MFPRLLALTLCLLVFGPSAANADWSDPFDVSSPGSSRREARVAVAPSGAAVVAWLARDGATAVLQARRIEPDGTRGPILDLSATGRIPAAPDVAIDADGHATVVWSDRGPTGAEEIVRARRITAAGAVEPTIDLSPPGLGSKLPDVEIAASGTVTVLWERPASGTVHLRRIDPTGGPGATLDISLAGGQADLAVGAGGDAYVAWVSYDGGDQIIEGRGVDAGGDLEEVDTWTDDDLLAFSPRVALDASGTPTVAWVREDGSIELRRALGATEEVGVGDTVGDLAVDAGGNATVVWIGTTGASRAMFLRRVPATGPPGPVNDLWSGGDDHDPRLALDGAGTPTLIWGNATTTQSTVRARSAPAGAAFGPIADLWPPATGTFAAEPALASNAAGEMTAVWRRGDGAEEAIVAARFTHPAPVAPSNLAPPPVPAPPGPSCEAVTVGKLRTAKGRRVAAVLKVDRPARLDLLSATLFYRRDGKRRAAGLRVKDLTVDDRATVRFKPPARVRPGQRVTLELRLRARSTVTGCPYGAATTRRLTTRVPS